MGREAGEADGEVARDEGAVGGGGGVGGVRVCGIVCGESLLRDGAFAGLLLCTGAT